MLRAMALMALVGLPGSVALTLLGPEIVLVFLGPTWTGAVASFQILACATFLRFAYRIGQTIIHARGRVWLYAATQVVFAGGVVGGAWRMAPEGPEAVAAVAAVMMGVNFLMLTGLALREIRLSPLPVLAAWIPGALNAAAVGLAVVAALHGLRPVAPPAAVLAGGVAAAGAWAALALTFGGRLLLGEDGQRFCAWLRELCGAGAGAESGRRPTRGCADPTGGPPVCGAAYSGCRTAQWMT
jgi:PST family polysaccharide transporter